MKDRSSLFILLLIIFILFGIIFLRRSGILTINHSNTSTNDFLDDYYDKVNPDDKQLPNVQDTVNMMQTTKK